MINIIEKLGQWLIKTAEFFYNYYFFTLNIIKGVIKFKVFNPAISLVVYRQIYFTGVQILPMYTVISIVFGLMLVGGLSQFLIMLGAQERIGMVLTTLTVRELAPLVTAILLILRSSTAVTAEIALMKMNNEIETLQSLSIDPHDYLYLPRILAGFVSMAALSTFFMVVAISGGYFILSFSLNISFDFLIRSMFDSLSVSDVLCFIFKIFTLGYFIMSLPIFSAIEIKGAVTDIPIALLKGMLRIFYSIILVEGIGLFI